MYLETYPLTVNAGHAELVYENNRKSTLTFLYIGRNNQSPDSFSDCFKSGMYAEGFAQARLIINSLYLNDGNLPDAIVIDMPLNQPHLESFSTFLKEKNLVSKTTVIYNETHLTAEKTQLLQRLELIDDVTDIHAWDTNIAKKVSFLKKMKNQHRTLYAASNAFDHYQTAGVANVFSFKRLFDIMVSSILILLLSPVFIAIAIAIKLGSKGPVVYLSSRAGRGFKVFKFYKFRTMEVDADKKIESLAHLNQYAENNGGARFLKLCNDPRVTKIGKFLRRTSLDELPQLFNVLKGDMSIVGNRPLPIYEAATLTTNEFVERFMAPAGITGLWQIKKRGKPDMTVEERISLDISYARKSSLMYDMWILAQTPAALFQKSNT